MERQNGCAMQGGTLLGECTQLWLDRTIWVIWIWAEIWMLLCDMTLSQL